jgi:aspartyl-tRNA(Asn)/glutamyl-tRNA(Gln) amidotransferase subunit C
MKITKDTITHLAELSKLEFSEAEAEAIQKDLQNMIGMVEKLDEINTDDVEPLLFMSAEHSVTRADTTASSLSQEEALQNAPKSSAPYFIVPKVVKK